MPIARLEFIHSNQMSRTNYVQEQEVLKLQLAQRKVDKENSKLIEEMIYGVPKGGKYLWSIHHRGNSIW